MNKLVLKNSRHIDLCMDDVVYRNDNKITTIFIIFPDKIDEYPRKDCNVELRAILPNGDYLPYNIPTAEGKTSFLITNDLTEAAQVVKLMMIITHNGNVIGSTNEQEINVKEPTKTLEPLTPRAEFDEVIADQRETISEQEQTITQQASQIAEDAETISGLNTQVGELSTENTRLENLTDTQRETIQNMIDNPPQPKLYTPPEPITPESETRVYTPPQNYDGFASFSIKGNKYLNVDLQKFLAREVDFDLEIQADIIGNYLCYGQRGLINCILTGSPIRTGAYAFQDCSSLQTINLPSSLTSIGTNGFYGCASLQTINLPSSLTSIGSYAFSNCTSLMELTLPGSLTSIGGNAFQNCTSLTELTLPGSLTSIGGNAFQNCISLTELTLAQGFNCNGLNVSASTHFTAETIVACLEALADRTGQTAYTITFGSTNLKKLTNEQKAIATNKNWNIA